MTLARWTLCLVAGLGFTLGAGAALPPPLERVLHEQHLPPAAVSVLVQAVDARAPLLALNMDEPRNPASTIKLVTTFAALELLGGVGARVTEIPARKEYSEGRAIWSSRTP